MNFTTLLPNQETKLPNGTYRITKGSVTSPAVVDDCKIRFLLKDTLLEGKCQYKKL